MNPKSSGTLLVVDDEAEVREIIALNVASLGYNVLESPDGMHALEVMRQHEVDVIISDLMMPRMTGLGLLSALRDEGFQQPFIFLTAYPSQDSTLQALRLGAFDYMEKPFEGDELQALVNEAMRVSLEMLRLGVRQVVKSITTPANHAAEDIQKLRTLRYKEPLQGRGGDEGAYHKLTNLFITEATPQLLFCEAAIKGLIDPDDRAFELGYLFRVMQGLAAAGESIGAKNVVALARAAERFYTALRVRPRAVNDALVSLAQSANGKLQEAVATLTGDGQGGVEVGAEVECLMQAAAELEGGEGRRVS